MAKITAKLDVTKATAGAYECDLCVILGIHACVINYEFFTRLINYFGLRKVFANGLG